MGYKFRGFEIPDRMMEPLERYVMYGSHVGDFLTAVISNDLRGAVNRADGENIQALPAYVGYLHNEVPSVCWGSREKMREWQEYKGIITMLQTVYDSEDGIAIEEAAKTVLEHYGRYPTAREWETSVWYEVPEGLIYKK